MFKLFNPQAFAGTQPLKNRGKDRYEDPQKEEIFLSKDFIICTF